MSRARAGSNRLGWPLADKKYRLNDEDVVLLILAGEPKWTSKTFNWGKAKVGDLYWHVPSEWPEHPKHNGTLVIFRLESLDNQFTKWSVVYRGKLRD